MLISQLPEEDLIHKIDQHKPFPKLTVVVTILIITAGIISGYILSNKAYKITDAINPGKITSSAPAKRTVGSADTKTFPDSAEGTLEAGGYNGEGTHKLVREGGDSQTVYLTSSVIDMEEFVGQKVRIWGATFAAKKAGWLMDVGKVEVL